MGQMTLPDGTIIYNVPDYAVQQKNPGAPRTAADVGIEATLNAGPSALQYGKDTYQALRHPIETVKAVGSLVTDPAARQALGDFYKQRYGGWEQIKNTIATDPVGFMADVATPLTLGGSAAARVPGVVGTAGRVARTAGEVADPLTALGQAAKWTGKVAGEVALGPPAISTGAGVKPIREAVRIGYNGTPEEHKAFLDNLLGRVSKGQVLKDAQAGLKAIRADRSSAYKRQMDLLRERGDKLQFQPVIDEWNALQQSFLADGGLSRIGPATQDTLRKISGVIEQWARTPDAHTINGLDALKQRIRDEVGNFSALSEKEQLVVTSLTQKIGDVIGAQAPEYAQIMRNYSEESRMIDEIEGALSLGNTKLADTAIRKLQSIMRNNVNTNYDQRAELVDALQERGGKQIVPALAGQSLNAWEPRGQVGAASMLASAGTPIASALWNGDWKHLLAIPAIALSSPRVVGSSAYGAGWAAGRVSDLAKALGGAETGRVAGQASFQSGRWSDERDRRLARALAGLRQ